MRVPRDSVGLVKIAVRDLGEGSPTKLANVLKLGANGYQRVNRWLKGSEPGYAETVAMLDRLGLLNTTEGAARGEVTPLDPLEATAKGVAELLVGQAQILAALGVPEAAAAASDEAQAQQQDRSKRRRDAR